MGADSVGGGVGGINGDGNEGELLLSGDVGLVRVKLWRFANVSVGRFIFLRRSSWIWGHLQ